MKIRVKEMKKNGKIRQRVFFFDFLVFDFFLAFLGLDMGTSRFVSPSSRWRNEDKNKREENRGKNTTACSFSVFWFLIFFLSIFGARYGKTKIRTKDEKKNRKIRWLVLLILVFSGQSMHSWKNHPQNCHMQRIWKGSLDTNNAGIKSKTFLVAFETDSQIHGQAIPGANSDEPGECPHRWLPAPQRRNEVFEDGLTRAHPRQPLQVTMGYGDADLIDVRWGIRGIACYLPMGTPSVAWIQCRSKMWCRKLKGR